MQKFLDRTSTFHQEPIVGAVFSAQILSVVQTLTFGLQHQHTVFVRLVPSGETLLLFQWNKCSSCHTGVHDSIMITVITLYCH